MVLADALSSRWDRCDPEDAERAALEAVGEGAYTRRLTDKILAAFNQAYATGEPAAAELLRQALERAVASAEAVGGGRRHHRALDQAALWVRFVDARNAYLAARDPLAGAGDDAIDDARARMLEAWEGWSAG